MAAGHFLATKYGVWSIVRPPLTSDSAPAWKTAFHAPVSTDQADAFWEEGVQWQELGIVPGFLSKLTVLSLGEAVYLPEA